MRRCISGDHSSFSMPYLWWTHSPGVAASASALRASIAARRRSTTRSDTLAHLLGRPLRRQQRHGLFLGWQLPRFGPVSAAHEPRAVVDRRTPNGGDFLAVGVADNRARPIGVVGDFVWRVR